jgi:hypothetical protein
MNFLNSIAEWFNNTIIKTTFDPAADALKQVYRQNVSQNLGMLQQTIGNIGGGLGNVIFSIPGIGEPTRIAMEALRNETEELMEKAKSMTPDQIAEKNDEITRKYNEILARAKADGVTYEEQLKKEGIENKDFSITKFFNEIFSNTLYLSLFVLVIVLGLLGSSLAANAAVDKPFYYKIYYMVYGFILFPVPIIQAIFNHLNHKRLFYSLWAPLYKGTSFGLFHYNAALVDSSHFTAGSLIANPTERSARSALLTRQQAFRTTFQPNQVLE